MENNSELKLHYEFFFVKLHGRINHFAKLLIACCLFITEAKNKSSDSVLQSTVSLLPITPSSVALSRAVMYKWAQLNIFSIRSY